MTPKLDGRAWYGKAQAYGTTFTVELFPSQKYPGYYHFAMYCDDDSVSLESKAGKPIRAKEENGVSFWTLFKVGLSNEHGLVVDDLEWQEVRPEDLPRSGERFDAGE